MNFSVKKLRTVFEKEQGLTLIEILIIAVIICILILAAVFAYQRQLAKGRDAKRKVDLDELQNTLEDYLNDNVCYPERSEIGVEGVICKTPFAPYRSRLPCDPINSINYHYFYSHDDQTCKSWYKIYTKLEIEDDPIIEMVGCSGGCGPSNNYNYWVGSPNVTEVAQLPGEWWPDIPGVTISPEPPTPSLPPGVTPTNTPILSPTPTNTPGVEPTSTPTPEVGYPLDCTDESEWGCNWACGVLPWDCGSCCPGSKECILVDFQPKCCHTERCPEP